MSKIKTKDSVLGMEKSKTEKQIQTESVNRVINKIGEEIVSLNSLIRAFVAVSEDDTFANYMLETICDNTKDARIVLNVNQIKAFVIKHYPYKHENQMLIKDGELYRPMTKYSKDVIRKAFYAIVNPKKDKPEIVVASEEQIAAADLAKEMKRESAKDVRKSKEDFIERLMNAGNQELAWMIIQEYKAKNNPTESEEKSEK